MKKLALVSLVALSFLGGYIASNHEKSVVANENKQGNVNRIENNDIKIELVNDEYGYQLFVTSKNNMVLRSEIEVNDKDNFNELFFVARNKDFKIK